MNWISVDDALPVCHLSWPVFARGHFSDLVLVWPRDPHVAEDCIAVYCYHRQRFESYNGQELYPTVTHWMPLPEGPQDASGQGCQPPVKDAKNAKDAIKDANRKRDSR